MPVKNKTEKTPYCIKQACINIKERFINKKNHSIAIVSFSWNSFYQIHTKTGTLF